LFSPEEGEMRSLRFGTITGGTKTVSADVVGVLEENLRGHLVDRDSPGYNEARTLWNGMIDKHPTLIVRCAGPADVIASVNFAREHQLLLAVRGGGHNVAGSALVDDGMVIDLSDMRGVRVDPERRLARVEGGATLGDVDHETQAHGLATPLGLVSRTGVAGLTLGGGFGGLTRRHGLSCDNLRSLDIVTADGKLRTASETQNPDLFWAARGGGGNFGVVTSLEYELHPVGPEVMVAATFYAGESAERGLRYFRDFMRGAPRELMALSVLWSLPEGPFFPPERARDPVLIFVGFYSGDVEEGKSVVAPLRTFEEPLVDLSGPMPWVDAESFFDPNYPDGMLYYWKSAYLDTIGDDVTEVLASHAMRRASPVANIGLWYLGGAMRDVAPHETAIWHRNVEAMVGAEANWQDPADSDANVQWARDLVADLEPYASDGSYVNFGGLLGDADNPARKIYGGNYQRLLEVKRKYDPDNLFRVNKNIDPTDSVE
jgi:FAD/FMN-containing dehydrogenase